jgi:hypothetical protein
MALAACLALGAGACAAKPPTGWKEGGAAVLVPRARWVFGELAVDLGHDGKVHFNGRHRWTIDRAGRIYDEEGQPLALLGKDGVLVGPDDETIGWVGAAESRLPGQNEGWLTLGMTGELVRHEEEGSRPFGVWMGCTAMPQTAQICTLVSHLVALRLREAAREPDVSFGVGVGVSVPVR